MSDRIRPKWTEIGINLDVTDAEHKTPKGPLDRYCPASAPTRCRGCRLHSLHRCGTHCRSTLLRSTAARRSDVRNIDGGSYNKFFGVRHVVALDISSSVQTFCAIVDGGVVREAAGERLAEMVDGGVVGDEARSLDERLRGDESDELALADAVADNVVDLLLLLWAVERPCCCRFVLAAGACAVGKKDLPDCIEFHKGGGVKKLIVQKNGGGGVGVWGIIGGIFTTTTILFSFFGSFFL